MGLFTRVARFGAVLVAATAAALGATALPAAASPTCYGYSCHGHDPVTYNCVATSTKSVPVNQGTTKLASLDNRYSYGCNANWARAQLTSTAISWGYGMTVSISTTDSYGHYEFMCYPGPSDTGQLIEGCYSGAYYHGSAAAYTDMVDGTNVTHACAYVYTSSGTLVSSACVDQ